MYKIRFFVDFRLVHEATGEISEDFSDLIKRFLEKFGKAMQRERKLIDHYYIIEKIKG
ncbi:MAG: hypothetical protein ACM3MI_03800 [Clostridiales bacterium]